MKKFFLFLLIIVANTVCGQNSQDIFEFSFPCLLKVVGDTKTVVKPQTGGVFKLVLDLSAEDRLQASLVEQNGLKKNKMLSLVKDLNDAQLEMLTDGCLEGLDLEADEGNYKLGIFSKQNNTRYIFDLEALKKINATFERAEVVRKRLSFFFLKMNSKIPVEIKEIESKGKKIYYCSSNHYNIDHISISKSPKYGLTISFALSEEFSLNIKSGSYMTEATFHCKDDSITGKIRLIIKDDKTTIIHICNDIAQDLLNSLCKKDVYEITINGITNEAFCSAATFKALIEKMK